MPLGFTSFSFDLFGFSRRGPSDEVGHSPRLESDPTPEVKHAGDRNDDDRSELDEVSFWGLGFFPVL